jgi:hypothetical protein
MRLHIAGMKPRASSMKHSPSNNALRSNSNKALEASSHTSSSPLHEDPSAAAGGDSSRHTSMSGSYSGTSTRTSSLEQAANFSALSLIQQMPKGTCFTHTRTSLCENGW